MGGFPLIGSPAWKNRYKGHVLKRNCPTDRTGLGIGGCWHLRAPLKLSHLGRLYFPLDILPRSSYQGNSLESVYVAVVGLG